MAFVQQTIEKPFGINVFGSALVRVEPDIASLNFSVSRLVQTPKEAFNEAREGTKKVAAFLAEAKIKEVSSSRINLSETFKHTGGESRFVGYTGQVNFHVLLYDLNQIEDVLVGIVDAGANNIKSVDLQTTHLKEIRADARRRAIDAAREKAENYCKAAGVILGQVLHIEDVNPDSLRGYEGHVYRETPVDDSGELKAFDPGSITIGAAVMMSFEITHGRQDSKKAGYFKPQDKDTK